jgi:hypothetical protein
VTLKTPFDGIAYITSEGEESRTVQVEKSIKIGSIGQDNSVHILMWSTEFPELKHEGLFRLTHRSGSGTIQFPVWEFGAIYKSIRDYIHRVFFGLGLLAIISLLGLLFIIEHLVGVAIIPFRGTYGGNNAAE